MAHYCVRYTRFLITVSEPDLQVLADFGTTFASYMNIEQFADIRNSSPDEELEMLCIFAPLKTSAQIMEDVNKEFGMTSPANGIVVALPTEKAYKI